MKIHEQRSASATAVGIGLMVALAVLDDEIDQELAPGRQVMSMKKWCLNSANQSTEGFVFERNGLERPGQFGNNRGEGRGGLDVQIPLLLERPLQRRPLRGRELDVFVMLVGGLARRHDTREEAVTVVDEASLHEMR